MADTGLIAGGAAGGPWGAAAGYTTENTPAAFNDVNNWVNNQTGANQNFGGLIPNVNPEIGTEAQSELTNAENYSGNVGAYEGLAGGQEQASAYNAINQGKQGANVNANATGNLYSTNTQNQENSGTVTDLNNLASERMQSNNRIQSTSNNMLQSAIKSKLGYASAENQRAGEQYNANMQGYGMKFNLASGLMSGLGGVSSHFVGGANPRTPTTQATTTGQSGTDETDMDNGEDIDTGAEDAGEEEAIF